MELSEDVIRDIRLHAIQEYPRECCGLIVNHEDVVFYFPCRNIAPGTEHFSIHPEDYAEAADESEILAIVHSHPNESANPSEADIVSCEKSELPWVIIGWPSAIIRQIEPTGYKAPLEGRPFYHGVLDCFTLIKDALKEFCNLDIPDFSRKNEWWLQGENLYLDNYEKAGFVRVEEKSLKKYDIVLMQVNSKVPNHAAVYLGDNIILHHLVKRLSCKDVYGGYWQKHTHSVYRHSSLMDK